MLVDLNLDQFSIHCFSPGLTSQHLKAWSSRAHRNLKGQGGRAPCLQEGPAQRQPTGLDAKLGVRSNPPPPCPQEEPRPGLDPALRQPAASAPRPGWGRGGAEACFPSAVCGRGTMATVQPPRWPPPPFKPGQTD